MRRAIALLAVFLSSVCVLHSEPQKKRLAVMDFEFGAVQRWWDGNWDIGKGISDLIVDELLKDGTYRLIERKKLDTLLAEQNFSNSDRADPNGAAKIGKMLSVNAMVVGSITQFGTEKKESGVGGALGKWGGFGGGKYGTQKGKAKVAVTARIVDVNTGEILASSSGTGESSRSGLILGGVGAGSGGFGAGEISMGSKDFRESILGEATVAAVQQLARQLVMSDAKIPTSTTEIRGLIADVSGNSLTLNVGSSNGVQVGDQLKILRVIRSIKDPATGKVIREVTEEVGQITITEVEAASSVGTASSGASIKVGDMVKN